MDHPQPSLIASIAIRWLTRALVAGICTGFSACASKQQFDQGLTESDTGADTSSVQGPSNTAPGSVQDSGGSAVHEIDATKGLTGDQAVPTAELSLEERLQEILTNYCDAGPVSCYLMDKTENKLLLDRGPADLSINPQDSKIVDPGLSSYLFDSALQVVRGERPESLKTFTLPEHGIVGFDVWIKPNSTSTNTRWNAIALDGFLSIQTLGPEILACKYNVGLSPTFPLIPKVETLQAKIEFPKDEFVHVGCAYDGSNVSLWINGVEHQGPKHDRVLLPETSRYLLNWSSAFQTPFDGQLGPLRVWHDIPTMRARLRGLHQLLSVMK